MDATFHQLSVFQAVATQSSFSRAAAQLHLSQPVVSRTLADLEHHLGVRLVDRSSRRVTLTADGQVFLKIAQRILGGYKDGIAAFESYRAGEAGVVTVAALPSVSALILPGVIAGFLERHPAVHVRVVDRLSDVVAEHVRRGRADLGVADVDDPPVDLLAEPMWRDRFVAVVHPGSPLASATSLGWAELSRLPFVVTTRGGSVRRLTDQAFARVGARTDNLIEASQFATVAGMISAGLGVSALPDSLLPLLAFANTAQVPLVDPVVERQLGILIGDPATLNPAGALFLQHLRLELTRLSVQPR